MFKNINDVENNKLQVRVKIMLLKTRIGLLKEGKKVYKTNNYSKKFEMIIASMGKVKMFAEGNLRVLSDVIELNHILLVLMLEIEHLKECEESIEKDKIIRFLKDNVSIFDKILECLNEIK